MLANAAEGVLRAVATDSHMLGYQEYQMPDGVELGMEEAGIIIPTKGGQGAAWTGATRRTN